MRCAPPSGQVSSSFLLLVVLHPPCCDSWCVWRAHLGWREFRKWPNFKTMSTRASSVSSKIAQLPPVGARTDLLASVQLTLPDPLAWDAGTGDPYRGGGDGLACLTARSGNGAGAWRGDAALRTERLRWVYTCTTLPTRRERTQEVGERGYVCQRPASTPLHP